MSNFTLQECIILNEYGLKATISNGELTGFTCEPEKAGVRQRIKEGIKRALAEILPVCRF